MAVDKYCDFCHEPNPRLAFPVEDFIIPVSGIPSSGGFAACGICAAMVEANDREGLLKRSLSEKDNGWTEFPKEYKAEGDAALKALHDRFWTAMDKVPSKKPIAIDWDLPDDTHQRVAEILKWPVERVTDLLRKAKIVSEQKAAGGGGVRAMKKDVRDIDAILAALNQVLEATVADRAKLDDEVRQLYKDYYADRIVLPPDFAPYSFAGFLSHFLPKSPDVAIDLAMRAGAISRSDISLGVEHIERLQEQRLILFAKHMPTDAPAMFMATEKHFASQHDLDLANNLLGFFQVAGEFDTSTGKTEPIGVVTGFNEPLDVLAKNAPYGIMGSVLHPNDWSAKAGVKTGDPVFKLEERTFADWRKEFPLAITTLAEECRVSRRVVEETLQRWITDGYVRFVEVPGTKGEKGIGAILPKEWPLSGRRSEDMIRKLFTDKFEFGHRFKTSGKAFMSETGEKPGAVIFPTAKGNEPPEPPQLTTRRGETAYARAIEMQFAALSYVNFVVTTGRERGMTHVDGFDINDLYALDGDFLKRADTFCWFEDPMHAVEAAAATLPTSVRLTRELAPHQAAWWFFKEPMRCETQVNQDTVIALLWGWTTFNGRSGLRLSTYIYDVGDKFRTRPTMKLFWEEGTSLHACIKAAAQYEDLPAKDVIERAKTLAAVEQLSRFFAAGALWTQQKILTYTKGHVERHERKRAEKILERPLNDVQIIQLRRKESAPRPDETSLSRVIDWKCRWVVRGFWREQYYPSKGRHEPKWINSFIKGPDDKPLKTPSHRVYVVNR